MLNFQTDPPATSTKYALDLIRTPATGTLHLICTSAELVGTWTHYFGGRTIPCTPKDGSNPDDYQGDTCEACLHGSSKRWHGYVSAFNPHTNQHLLFESTAAATAQLKAYRAKHGTLRGCEFKATRTSKRPNARVKLQMKPADLTILDLPTEANIVLALCHIWGIPATEATVSRHGPDTSQLRRTKTALPVDRAIGLLPASITENPNGDRPA